MCLRRPIFSNGCEKAVLEERDFMQKTLTVCGNGEPIYDIVLDTAFDGLGSRLEALGVRGRRVCVVTDSRVASLYLDHHSAIRLYNEIKKGWWTL